jgi:hypothetical protein
MSTNLATTNESSFSSIITPDDPTAARLAVISRAQQFAQRITTVTVTSPESYTVAGETLRAVKSLRDELETVCRPVINAHHQAHKQAMEEFKRGDSPLMVAESNLKRALLGYDQEQERIRRVEQARLQKIAEDAAREEQRKAEEERRLQAAIEAEAAGDKEEAKAILEAPIVEQPVFVAPVVLATTTPKVEGLSKRQVWKCEVTDLMALVRAVAAGTIPLAAIEANTVFLGQQARSLKSEMRYPGVKVWPEETMSGRA